MDRLWFDVAAGPLPRALIQIGLQAGISVATTDPTMARRMLPRSIRGRMTAGQALSRLLAGSGLRAVRTGPRTYRIEATRSAKPRPTPAPTPYSPPPPAAVVGPDIVVTASKRGVTLPDYPGSAHRVSGADLTLGAGGQADTRALVDLLPVLATTSLGPGREKLFVRGIADSSFAGGSQATVGQYLGDIQLNYSAPDPDLMLYDIASVELLEGPQGTLYGTGALGGVMRVTPNAPVPGRWSAEGGLRTTHVAHGGVGGEAMGVVNMPLGDAAALRLLGYGSRTPGYIDDSVRALHGVNASRTDGGRAMLRLHPASGWTVDVGGVYQRIDNRDAQYVDGGAAPLTRATAVAQPSFNDFRMASVTAVHRSSSGQTLTAALSLVHNDLAARYDAAGRVPNATAIETASTAHVVTGELRLARHRESGNGFVLGSYATLSDDRLLQSALNGGDGRLLRGVGNRVVDIALFGEATLPVGRTLAVTTGLRATYLDFTGSTFQPGGGQQGVDVEVPSGGDITFLPSAALRWRPAPGWIGYLRYQRGVRVGGYALDTEASPDAADGASDGYVVFRPDTLDTVEAGMRVGDAASRFRGGVALSLADWRNIQADLYGTTGPYTANIGHGRVLGLEASAHWQPVPNLHLAGTMFLARSVLSDPAPAFSGDRRQALPNTPAVSLRVAMNRRWSLSGDDTLLLRGSVRYTGRSWLGVGPLHIAQGDFAQTEAGLIWTRKRTTLSLDVANLFDVQGNRFSLGNPLTLRTRAQRTPLQPRTITLGIGVALD